MKLLLLDDHKLFGESIQLLLEEQEEVELCSYATNIDEFFKKLKNDVYDILLIDINLKNEKTGFDIVKKITEENPNQKIVILSSYDMDNYKDRAFKLGVKDFINKSVEIEELVFRLKEVNFGKINNKLVFIANPLTEREVEVLRELIKGENKKVIAKKLFISERTLYNHIANINEKLGTKNALEAYNKAMEIGYINPIM